MGGIVVKNDKVGSKRKPYRHHRVRTPELKPSHHSRCAGKQFIDEKRKVLERPKIADLAGDHLPCRLTNSRWMCNGLVFGSAIATPGSYNRTGCRRRSPVFPVELQRELLLRLSIRPDASNCVNMAVPNTAAEACTSHSPCSTVPRRAIQICAFRPLLAGSRSDYLRRRGCRLRRQT